MRGHDSIEGQDVRDGADGAPSPDLAAGEEALRDLARLLARVMVRRQVEAAEQEQLRRH